MIPIYQVRKASMWYDVDRSQYDTWAPDLRRVVVLMEHANMIDVERPGNHADAVRQVVAACGRIWPKLCQQYVTLGGHKVTPEQFAAELDSLNRDPATCWHSYQAVQVGPGGVVYECRTCFKHTDKLTKEEIANASR